MLTRIAKHTLKFSRISEDGKKEIITVKAGETFDFSLDELRRLNKAQPGVTKKLYGVIDNEQALPAGTPVVGDVQDGPEDSTRQKRTAPKPVAVGTDADTGQKVTMEDPASKDIEDEL